MGRRKGNTSPRGSSTPVPSQISEEQWKKLRAAARLGMSMEDCAVYAGLRASTLVGALQSSEDFRSFFDMKRLEGKKHHLSQIYNGGKGWQSSAWWLERMFRKEFQLPRDVGKSSDKENEERLIKIRKVVRTQAAVEPGNLRIAQ